MPKNQLLGHCQLVLQGSDEQFIQELGAMSVEAEAEKREQATLKDG